MWGLDLYIAEIHYPCEVDFVKFRRALHQIGANRQVYSETSPALHDSTRFDAWMEFLVIHARANAAVGRRCALAGGKQQG